MVEEYCGIILHVKSKIEHCDIMTSRSGSHFCTDCPVVVFDKKALSESATIGFGGNNLQHFVKGIVDFEAIPDDKKHLPLGTEENPTPLVKFLPDLENNISAEKKVAILVSAISIKKTVKTHRKYLLINNIRAF